MDLATFYGWLGISSTSLGDANRNNGMYDAALKAWSQLSQYALVFFLLMVVFSIGMAIYYYTSYNNQPKRHYTPKQWLYIGIASLVIVFLITFVLAYVIQKTGNIGGLLMLEFKLALANTIYAAVFYFLTSLIWCNIPQLPTNAYRFFKL